MPVSVAVGQFAANTTTGNQTVSSITDQDGGTFTPKVLILWATNLTTNATGDNARFFMGCATSTSERWTVCYADDDNAGTSNSGRSGSSSLVARILATGGPTTDGEADFVSFGSGQFVINWSDAPSSAWLINYMAIGGSDITAQKAGTVSIATTGGSQSFTDPGFLPSFLLTGHELLSPLGNSSTAEIGFGAASGASDQAANVLISRDAQGTTLVGQWQKSGRVALGMASDVAADYEAALSTFDANGFTLSVSDLPAATRVLCYLAIQGGQWKVGVDTETATNTTKDTSLTFDPVAVMLSSVGSAANASIDATHANFSLGASNETSEASAWYGSQDNQDVSQVSQSTSNTKAIELRNPNGAGLEGSADATTGTAKFTLTWGSTDGTQREFIYVAVGASTNVTQKSGFGVAGLVGAGESASEFAETGWGAVGTVGAGAKEFIGAVVYLKSGFGVVGTVGAGVGTRITGAVTYTKAGFGKVGTTTAGGSTLHEDVVPHGVSIAFGASSLDPYPPWTRIDPERP